MNKIKIIPIGSGSTGNSMYIEFSNHKIIVDLGLSMKNINNALNSNGINLEDVEAFFITHSHHDHVSGIKVISKHYNQPYYMSRPTSKTLSKYHLNSEPLKLNEPVQILNNLTVTPFKTSHDCSGSCGFIFECEGIKIGYATDLGYVSSGINNLLKGSDLIVLESNHDEEMLKNGNYPQDLKERIASDYGHLSNLDCAYTISNLIEHGTINFLLAHLSRENNTPELALSTTLNKINNPSINVKVLPIYSTEDWEFPINK